MDPMGLIAAVKGNLRQQERSLMGVFFSMTETHGVIKNMSIHGTFVIFTYVFDASKKSTVHKSVDVLLGDFNPFETY